MPLDRGGCNVLMMGLSVARLRARSPSLMRRLAALGIRTVRLYMDDHCGTYAAAIAYYTLFSLIPLTVVVVSVLGQFVDRARVVNFIFDQIPLEQTASVEADLTRAVERAQQISPGAFLFGLGVLSWSASGVFGAVRRGLNATSHRPGQSYLHGKLLDFALIPALGLLIVLSVGLTAAVEVAFERAGDLGLVNVETSPIVRIAGYFVTGSISFCMFALLYRFVPSHRPRWREALAGAGCSTILFEAAKSLVAYAVREAPYVRDSALYVGLGTALAILFWVFVAASILLIGAEFSRALALDRRTVDADLESFARGGSGRRVGG